MILSLAAQRNRTAPFDTSLRRSRTTRPGRTGQPTNRMHPARHIQHQHAYYRIIGGEGQDLEDGNLPNVPGESLKTLDDIVEIVRPASKREPIPYINVPGPGETWEQLNQWRLLYNLPPVTH